MCGREVELVNNARKMGRRNILLTKLMIVFGNRTVELRTAHKREFDLDNGIWTIKDSKAGHTIIRPIHDSVVADIEELKDLYPDTPILLPPTNEPFATVPVSGQSLVKIPETINKRLQLEKWNMHDLRRTIQSHMLALRIDEGVTEKIIGHVQQGTKANYNKHDYLVEQLEAYDKWINHLDGLT